MDGGLFLLCLLPLGLVLWIWISWRSVTSDQGIQAAKEAVDRKRARLAAQLAANTSGVVTAEIGPGTVEQYESFGWRLVQTTTTQPALGWGTVRHFGVFRRQDLDRGDRFDDRT
jgi:hypothetical protein